MWDAPSEVPSVVSKTVPLQASRSRIGRAMLALRWDITVCQRPAAVLVIPETPSEPCYSCQWMGQKEERVGGNHRLRWHAWPSIPCCPEAWHVLLGGLRLSIACSCLRCLLSSP